MTIIVYQKQNKIIKKSEELINGHLLCLYVENHYFYIDNAKTMQLRGTASVVLFCLMAFGVLQICHVKRVLSVRCILAFCFVTSVVVVVVFFFLIF